MVFLLVVVAPPHHKTPTPTPPPPPHSNPSPNNRNPLHPPPSTLLDCWGGGGGGGGFFFFCSTYFSGPGGPGVLCFFRIRYRVSSVRSLPFFTLYPCTCPFAMSILEPCCLWPLSHLSLRPPRLICGPSTCLSAHPPLVYPRNAMPVATIFQRLDSVSIFSDRASRHLLWFFALL